MTKVGKEIWLKRRKRRIEEEAEEEEEREKRVARLIFDV